jgi:hypothetical protein
VLPRPKDKDDQMNKDDLVNSFSGSRRGDARPWRAAILVAALAVTALLAAACSGGGRHAPGSGSSSDQNTTAQLDAYASCIRSHGDPSFYFSLYKGLPTPRPGEDVTGIGNYFAYFNPSSPGYQAAKKACQHLYLSAFGPLPPPPSHQQFIEELKSANCMRSHGYPNYPDPNPTLGGHIGVIPGSPTANTPQFKAAAKTCGVSGGG